MFCPLLYCSSCTTATYLWQYPSHGTPVEHLCCISFSGYRRYRDIWEYGGPLVSHQEPHTARWPAQPICHLSCHPFANLWRGLSCQQQRPISFRYFILIELDVNCFKFNIIISVWIFHFMQLHSSLYCICESSFLVQISVLSTSFSSKSPTTKP